MYVEKEAIVLSVSVYYMCTVSVCFYVYVFLRVCDVRPCCWFL